MSYRGHIKDGKVLLDEPAELPEGAEVSIELISRHAAISGTTLWERLRSLAGSVEGPEDWARNHDHYIHGAPKRP